MWTLCSIQSGQWIVPDKCPHSGPIPLTEPGTCSSSTLAPSPLLFRYFSHPQEPCPSLSQGHNWYLRLRERISCLNRLWELSTSLALPLITSCLVAPLPLLPWIFSWTVYCYLTLGLTLTKLTYTFLPYMWMVDSDCCLRKSSRLDVSCPRFKLALPPTLCVALGVSLWVWLLPSLYLSLVPHLIAVIRKVKNHHWMTLTKLFQPSKSTFVKLDQMTWKELSSPPMRWLDVVLPQMVSPLESGSS